MCTHTCVELEISAAAYDEIAAKLKEADYHHVFMDNGSIDMSGIAVTRGIGVSVLKAALIAGTPIADGQLREIFAIEANENSQRASASAGSADRVSPTQREGAVPSPQGTADVAEQPKGFRRYNPDRVQAFRPADDEPMLAWLIVSAADELESILSKLVTSGETTISSTDIGAAALVQRLNTLCVALKAVRQP